MNIKGSIKMFVLLGLLSVGSAILFFTPVLSLEGTTGILTGVILIFLLCSVIILPFVVPNDFKNKKTLGGGLSVIVVIAALSIPGLWHEANRPWFEGFGEMAALFFIVPFVVSMAACFIFGKLFSYLFQRHPTKRIYISIVFALLFFLFALGTFFDLHLSNEIENTVNLAPVVTSIKNQFPQYFNFDNKSAIDLNTQPLLKWAAPKMHNACNMIFISPTRRYVCYLNVSDPGSDGLLERTIWNERSQEIHKSLNYVKEPIENCINYIPTIAEGSDGNFSQADHLVSCLSSLAKKEKDAKICFVISEHWADPKLYNSCLAAVDIH